MLRDYEILTEKELGGGYKIRIIHAPHEIAFYKDRIGKQKLFPSYYTESQITQFGKEQTVVRFGMGEQRVVSTETGAILLTSGIADCVGISVYDPMHKKSGLFHFSKNNFFSDLEDFFKQFNPATATIHMVSAWYSPELVAAVGYIEKQGFSITGFNVNDACVCAGELDKYVDKNHVPESYLRGDRVDISFMLDTATGKLGFTPIFTVQPRLDETQSSMPVPAMIFSKAFKPFDTRTLLEKGISHNFNIVQGYSVRVDRNTGMAVDTPKEDFDMTRDNFNITISEKNILRFSVKKRQDTVTGYFATAEPTLANKLKTAFPAEQQGQYQMYQGSVQVSLNGVSDLEKICSLLGNFPEVLKKEIIDAVATKKRVELKQ